MHIPLSKLKALMLYLSCSTSPRHAGKTKFMKLFYYLDFLHVKKYGTPVTGDQYYNLDRGPIPTVIMNMVQELFIDPENSELADTIAIETSPNSLMQKIVATRLFNKDDAKLFSDSELDTLKEVIRRFKDTDTNTIVRMSHNEAPWKATNYRDPIPYSLAGRDPDSNFTEAEIQTLNSI